MSRWCPVQRNAIRRSETPCASPNQDLNTDLFLSLELTYSETEHGCAVWPREWSGWAGTPGEGRSRWNRPVEPEFPRGGEPC